MLVAILADAFLALTAGACLIASYLLGRYLKGGRR